MTLSRLRPWLVSALPLLVVAALWWYHFAVGGSGEVGGVVVYRYESQRSAALALGAVLCLVFLVLVVVFPPGRGRRHRWLLVLALVLLPGVEFLAVAAHVFDASPTEQLRLPDGSTYRTRHSFLSPVTLTEEVGHGLLETREKTLGFAEYDHAMLLVRPAGSRVPPKGGESELTTSADGRWLVLLQETGAGPGDFLPSHQTSLVYDRRAGHLYESGFLEDVSPFVLIGPHDRLDPADVRAVLAKPKRVSPMAEAFTFPSVVTLLRDLSHPNAEVRTVAAQLLDRRKLRDVDHETWLALRTAAADTADPVAREAAERASQRATEASPDGQ